MTHYDEAIKCYDTVLKMDLHDVLMQYNKQLAMGVSREYNITLRFIYIYEKINIMFYLVLFNINGLPGFIFGGYEGI